MAAHSQALRHLFTQRKCSVGVCRSSSTQQIRPAQKAGVTHDVKEYPAASHAFLNDAETGPHLLRPLLRITGIGPEPDSAKDAWDRIERFFATHLH
ncbi:MAG TPA: dienelactone hydrolase family protein [Mycobacterium sp.]|nr:dienelactone hydrolase family protein [Mycobacterium sp.]